MPRFDGSTKNCPSLFSSAYAGSNYRIIRNRTEGFSSREPFRSISENERRTPSRGVSPSDGTDSDLSEPARQ
jgi:hypothetical protein